jgi:hypothetical protein
MFLVRQYRAAHKQDPLYLVRIRGNSQEQNNPSCHATNLSNGLKCCAARRRKRISSRTNRTQN